MTETDPGCPRKRRSAFVTGSSRGIGRGIALRLGREGYHVFVTYLQDKAGGEDVATTILERGGRATLIQLDVRSEDSVRASFETVAEQVHALDVLVNNAVTEVAKNLEDATFEEWKLVVSTKLDGVFLSTKYALPLLRRSSNASWILITSHSGEKPNPDYIAYCIGAAGSNAFFKAMSLWLPRYGIRANAVCPGAVRTPLWDKLGGDDEDMWKGFARENPMGRIATVDDVADVVLGIVEDPTKFLNGNLIYVDGGAHLK